MSVIRVRKSYVMVHVCIEIQHIRVTRVIWKFLLKNYIKIGYTHTHTYIYMGDIYGGVCVCVYVSFVSSHIPKYNTEIRAIC